MVDTGKSAFGKLTSGLVPDTVAHKTIDFIYTQLPAWRDDPNRIDEQSENKLNLQLCEFLNFHAKRDFPMVCFEHEVYQSGRTSVDIAALPGKTSVIEVKPYRTYTIYDPVVVLECKRLPAPSYDREKEYVTGGIKHKSGGIQRFKLGLHGPNHNVAAMVGYLQDGSACDWHDKINKWIAELSNGAIQDTCLWNTSEILGDLEEVPSKGIANCQSTHNRSGNVKSNQILIRHLWITMYM